jgi:hypothetical protein
MKNTCIIWFMTCTRFEPGIYGIQIGVSDLGTVLCRVLLLAGYVDSEAYRTLPNTFTKLQELIMSKQQV